MPDYAALASKYGGTPASAPPQPSGSGQSIDAMIAPGGPLEDYANLVQGARHGGVGPLPMGLVGSARNVIRAGVGRAADAAKVALPAMRDEFAARGLESMGAPSIIAKPIRAILRSATKSSAAPASPRGSTPATPASPAAPSAAGSAATRPAGPQWSPQRLRNEVGLAARRQKATLTEQEYAVVEGMVQQGVKPADAVATVAQQIAKPPTAKLRLSVAEAKEYMRLRGAGKTDQEAAEAIRMQQKLAKQFGLPSSKTVQQQVAHRNATGRWSTEK
jgi:hypothetical protein